MLEKGDKSSDHQHEEEENCYVWALSSLKGKPKSWVEIEGSKHREANEIFIIEILVNPVKCFYCLSDNKIGVQGAGKSQGCWRADVQ